MSVNLQLKYQMFDSFALGGAWKYESERYAGQPDSAAASALDANGEYYYSQPIPAYAVLDLFAVYDVNKDLDIRLIFWQCNRQGLLPCCLQMGSFVYKGDARTARLTLNYNF